MRFKWLIFLLILTVVSCTKKEEKISNPELDGVWNLKNIFCHCPESNIQFGSYQWDVNTVDGNVIVIDHSDETDPYILKEGEYDLVLTKDLFKISSLDWGYELQDGQLILSAAPEEVYGTKYVFEK